MLTSILHRAEYVATDYVTSHAGYEDVTYTLVEDDLDWNTSVDAREDDGQWMLTILSRLLELSYSVTVVLVVLYEVSVTLLEQSDDRIRRERLYVLSMKYVGFCRLLSLSSNCWLLLSAACHDASHQCGGGKEKFLVHFGLIYTLKI